MAEQIKALVVDDEAAIRDFVGEVLRTDGWKVQEAETAERAFEMLHTDEWSLVFCDVMLGGATALQSSDASPKSSRNRR